MQIIRQQAYARAGLIGNPSDGYYGKTIAVIMRNFSASVVLYEWPELEIMWSQEDHSRFRSIRELVQDVKLHGYYGGVRLVKATINRFVQFCDLMGQELHDRNFSIRYSSSIPRQVGLAGSSAIVVATLRALMQFYNVDIPRHIQPSLVLSIESGELGITAGLQDRVIQVYEGVVSMDFCKEAMTTEFGLECGKYAPLDPGLLPPLYVAYSTEVSEPTEVTHTPLRTLFNQGDPMVTAAMRKFAELTVEGQQALVNGDRATFNRVINDNFDLRRSICQLAPDQARMVDVARSVGASAKFAGSGGAIVGSYEDQAMFDHLKAVMQDINCTVIKPDIRNADS
jgi:glucuronokinase